MLLIFVAFMIMPLIWWSVKTIPVSGVNISFDS